MATAGEPLHVLVCHSFYRQPGGERRAVEALCALLEGHGHRVTTFCRDNREIDGEGAVARLRLACGTVWSPRTYRALRREVRRLAPDVAHVHNVFPLLSPSLYDALAAERVPMVQTIHNFRFLCPNGLFYTHGEICERCRDGRTHHAVRLRCYRDSYAASAVYALAVGLGRRRGTFGQVDRFVAQTAFTRDKLVAGGVAAAERVTVIPPVVDVLPEPVAAAAPPYALYLGRLSEEKGPELLLDAFAALPTRRLVVAGDGPLAAPLAAEVARRRLGNVELVGFVDGEEKRRLLAEATLTVVPSRCYEAGLTLSGVESLAAGVPLVAADLGGLHELVTASGGGRLFTPGDAAALAAAAGELFDHPAARRATADDGRRWVAEQCGEARHHRLLVAAYREAIEHAAGGEGR